MWKISMYASRTLLWISMLAVCARQMQGQTANTGAIAGTVSDATGALIAGAALVVKNQATQQQRELTRDADGSFLVQFLPPGNYDLTVRAPGFEPLILKGVQVRITEMSRLKIQLTISSARAQITISAKPPLLQTENATLGRVIDRNTIEELPLVNRNFSEILGLTAGINTDIVDATQLGAGSQEMRANGARSGDNNFMLNRVDANSYSSNLTEVTPFGGAGIAIPAPDTIQEFKVQTSLYDAHYGRGPFSILDNAAGTLFGPSTLYTTRNLAPGATLRDASQSGSVSSRVNEFFKTNSFVPAPFVPDGGLIEGRYPVSGGTIFGSLGRNILRGPDQRIADIAVIMQYALKLEF